MLKAKSASIHGILCISLWSQHQGYSYFSCSMSLFLSCRQVEICSSSLSLLLQNTAKHSRKSRRLCNRFSVFASILGSSSFFFCLNFSFHVNFTFPLHLFVSRLKALLRKYNEEGGKKERESTEIRMEASKEGKCKWMVCVFFTYVCGRAAMKNFDYNKLRIRK